MPGQAPFAGPQIATADQGDRLVAPTRTATDFATTMLPGQTGMPGQVPFAGPQIATAHQGDRPVAPTQTDTDVATTMLRGQSCSVLPTRALRRAGCSLPVGYRPRGDCQPRRLKPALRKLRHQRTE